MEIKRKFADAPFKVKVKRYIINWLIGIDQLLNVALAGDPDETISSRFGKWLMHAKKDSFKYKVAFVVCLLLHKLDKNHCQDAIEEDEGRQDLIKNIKKKN